MASQTVALKMFFIFVSATGCLAQSCTSASDCGNEQACHEGSCLSLWVETWNDCPTDYRKIKGGKKCGHAASMLGYGYDPSLNDWSNADDKRCKVQTEQGEHGSNQVARVTDHDITKQLCQLKGHIEMTDDAAYDDCEDYKSRCRDIETENRCQNQDTKNAYVGGTTAQALTWDKEVDSSSKPSDCIADADGNPMQFNTGGSGGCTSTWRCICKCSYTRLVNDDEDDEADDTYDSAAHASLLLQKEMAVSKHILLQPHGEASDMDAEAIPDNSDGKLAEPAFHSVSGTAPKKKTWMRKAKQGKK